MTLIVYDYRIVYYVTYYKIYLCKDVKNVDFVALSGDDPCFFVCSMHIIAMSNCVLLLKRFLYLLSIHLGEMQKEVL